MNINIIVFKPMLTMIILIARFNLKLIFNFSWNSSSIHSVHVQCKQCCYCHEKCSLLCIILGVLSVKLNLDKNSIKLTIKFVRRDFLNTLNVPEVSRTPSVFSVQKLLLFLSARTLNYIVFRFIFHSAFFSSPRTSI